MRFIFGDFPFGKSIPLVKEEFLKVELHGYDRGLFISFRHQIMNTTESVVAVVTSQIKANARLFPYFPNMWCLIFLTFKECEEFIKYMYYNKCTAFCSLPQLRHFASLTSAWLSSLSVRLILQLKLTQIF